MREKAGAEVMKNELGKECSVVCDPTILLSADDYEQIIERESVLHLPPEYVACYFLGDNAEIMGELAKKYPIIDAYKDDAGTYRSVGDWLNILKNAKYIVTNSFHGCVFSLVYRKQFIVIPEECAGNDRIRELMALVGCDRFISEKEIITEELLMNPIDYGRVQDSLEQMRARGYQWIRSALAITPSEKKPLLYTTMKTYVKLLNVIPIIKIIHKRHKIRVRLFGLIPLVKIKNNALYLFEFLKIAHFEDRLW
jgi:hypothetical protein